MTQANMRAPGTVGVGHGGRLPGSFGNGPSVLPRQVREQSQHQVPYSATGFDPGEPACDAVHQALERFLPVVTVCAVTCGLMSSALLRRRMAEGTATPQEISSFESVSAAREQELDAAVTRIVDDIWKHRDEPLLIAGMNNQQFTLIQALRARGVPDGSLHPDTLVLSGGGNKGRALPDDYQQQLTAFYDGVRRVRSYGMTELQGSCLACEKGNYHVPPWVIPLVLDQEGETLLNPEHGVVEGRFAFLDVSLEGRWGGLISGDRVLVDFSACGCGRPGPAVLPDIRRYGDLGGDDKITCAATLDSYVRGMIHG